MSSVASMSLISATMPDRLMIIQTKLQNLASQLVSDPGQPSAILSSIEEVSRMMEPLQSLQQVQHPPVQLEALVSAVRAQLVRVHLLLDSALAYQSGAMLPNSSVPETYTPEGKWLSVAAGANLSLEA